MIYCKYGINELKYDVQCKPGILHTSDVTHAGNHFITRHQTEPILDLDDYKVAQDKALWKIYIFIPSHATV